MEGHMYVADVITTVADGITILVDFVCHEF